MSDLTVRWLKQYGEQEVGSTSRLAEQLVRDYLAWGYVEVVEEAETQSSVTRV